MLAIFREIVRFLECAAYALTYMAGILNMIKIIIIIIIIIIKLKYQSIVSIVVKYS